MKKYQLSDRTALFPDSRWPVTGQGIYNGRPAYKNESFKLPVLNFGCRLKSNLISLKVSVKDILHICRRPIIGRFHECWTKGAVWKRNMHTINMIKVLLYSPVLSLLLRHPQDGFSLSINVVFHLFLVSDDWSPPCPIIGQPLSGDRYHCVTRNIHHITE